MKFFLKKLFYDKKMIFCQKKFLGKISKKTRNRIFIGMKKIIITENQLKNLLDSITGNIEGSKNKFSLTGIVEDHGKKNK